MDQLDKNQLHEIMQSIKSDIPKIKDRPFTTEVADNIMIYQLEKLYKLARHLFIGDVPWDSSDCIGKASYQDLVEYYSEMRKGVSYDKAI